jgi:hypothetical protein
MVHFNVKCCKRHECKHAPYNPTIKFNGSQKIKPLSYLLNVLHSPAHTPNIGHQPLNLFAILATQAPFVILLLHHALSSAAQVLFTTGGAGGADCNLEKVPKLALLVPGAPTHITSVIATICMIAIAPFIRCAISVAQNIRADASFLLAMVGSSEKSIASDRQMSHHTHHS